MSPYLTRKQTSSVSNSNEVQAKDKASGSKKMPKTKNVANKTPTKSQTRIIGTRSMALGVRTRRKNNDTSSTKSQAKNNSPSEKQRNTGSKKLSKDNVINKTKPGKTTAQGSVSVKKQEVVDRKKKISKSTNKNVSGSKQMSLKESFLNQSKMKLLRSHKSSINGKGDTVLSKQTAAKKTTANKMKPVYKCLSPENPRENTSEIYEFKFDMNDSKERLPKKRKKKLAIKKTLTNNKAKNTSTKRYAQGAKVRKRKQTVDKNEPEEVKNVATSAPKKTKQSVIPIEENKKDETQKDLVQRSDKEVQVEEKTKEMKESVVEEHNASVTTIAKPVIRSVDDVSDKRIKIMDSSQVSNANDFRPFRPTNIFNNRATLHPKNALSHSLFEKSLSPITKSSEMPQINSPWRAPPLLTFSQVKNVFQSTPQNKTFDIASKRFVRTLGNESRQFGTPTKLKNAFQKNNENASAEGRAITNTPKLRNPLTSRKFGTEITNLDHSLQSNSIEQVSARAATDIENSQPNILSTSTVSSNINNIPKLDHERKRSSKLSPVKAIRKQMKEKRLENILSTSVNEQKGNSLDQKDQESVLISSVVERQESPLNKENQENVSGALVGEQNESSFDQKDQESALIPLVVEQQKSPLIEENQENVSGASAEEQKENFEPQPGPSGLQNNSIFNEQRVLRQSNLNNFLNIVEVPQSTTIKTPHGIFDDAASTPISGKPLKKPNESNMDLKNAFGFSDDDSNQDGDVSTSEPKVVDDKVDRVLKPVQNIRGQNVRRAARLSIGEIKNKLLVNKLKTDIYNKENVQVEKKTTKQSPIKHTNKPVVDIANFSDTFDVLSEAEDTSTTSASNFPLFADYEPTHFKEPPRHSYKRKRAVKFSFSEEESEGEDEMVIEHQKKRKKAGKLKKDQEERLMEWVKDINRTFSEIDQHELVIE